MQSWMAFDPSLKSALITLVFILVWNAVVKDDNLSAN